MRSVVIPIKLSLGDKSNSQKLHDGLYNNSHHRLHECRKELDRHELKSSQRCRCESTNESRLVLRSRQEEMVVRLKKDGSCGSKFCRHRYNRPSSVPASELSFSFSSSFSLSTSRSLISALFSLFICQQGMVSYLGSSAGTGLAFNTIDW